MKLKRVFYSVLLTGLVTSCDPGLSGDFKVFNETNETLEIEYIEVQYGVSDTVITNIEPGNYLIVNKLSGLGDNSTYTCCPDRVKILSIKSAAGLIKKDPSSCEDWILPNKTELKRYGKEPVKCEFHVRQTDIN